MRSLSLAEPSSNLAILFLRKEFNPMTKRELIEPTPGDKRYVRRDRNGRFGEQVDVGQSLARDRRTKAKTVAKKGEGDRGDQKTTH
jgi:hypothetical protein